MSVERKSGKVRRKEDNSNQTLTDQTLEIMQHMLMEEILPRLPVKTLVRLKCVCKNWVRTISSNYFAKSHLTRLSASTSSHDQAIMMFARSNDNNDYDQPPNSLVLVNWDDHEKKKELELLVEYDLESVSDFRMYDIAFVGCCHGLVCLRCRVSNKVNHNCNNNAEFFRIWNPATRAYRDIASPHDDEGLLLICDNYGFGYVSVSSDNDDDGYGYGYDYKIVCFFVSDKDAGTYPYTYTCSNNVHLYVFSSRKGTWKRVVSLHRYSPMIPRVHVPVAVWVGDTTSSSLFWVVKDITPHIKNDPDIILRFDLVTQQLTIIPFMDDSLNVCRHLYLSVINGSLSLFCRRANRTDVWMLTTQPGAGDSCWQKLYSLETDRVGQFKLVAVFDSDSDRGNKFLVQSEKPWIIDGFVNKLFVIGIDSTTAQAQAQAQAQDDTTTTASPRQRQSSRSISTTTTSKSAIDFPYSVIPATEAWNYIATLVPPFGMLNSNEYKCNFEIKYKE